MKRLLALCLLPLSAAAQDSAPVSAKILNMNEPVRSYPGGPLIGTLSKGVTVKLLEQKEDFVRVSFEGWVKDSSLALGASTGSQSTSAPQKAEERPELFELTGYELKELSSFETGDAKRVVLTLKLKNLTSAPVSEWEGILVIQSLKGEVLMRTTVRSEGEALPPGGSGSVSFNWKQGEKEYEVLTGLAIDQMKVLLLKTALPSS